MERINYFEHFSEEHQLKLVVKVDTENLAVCKACKQNCLDPYYYSCSICDFSLHDLHANLTDKYSNPFHPHMLTLFQTNVIGEPERFQCDACSRYIDGYTYGYKCEVCNLYLCVECTLLRPTIKEEENHVNHFAHLHPLVLVATHELKDGDQDLPHCNLCWELITVSSTELYRCESCRFYLHKSCAEFQLPKELFHFYHSCCLTLCTKRKSYNCNACLRNRGGWHYHCDDCNFRLDVDCSLLPDKLRSEGQAVYNHCMHGHPLILVDVNEDEDIHCVACQKVSSAKIYVCRWGGICRFFLHESCLQLPRQISHPFHPGPQLELSPECFPKARCSVCYNLCNGLFYGLPPNLSRKKQRKLGSLLCNLHFKCPVEVSTVTYQAHPHNLLFINNILSKDMDDDKEFIGIKCNTCGKDCMSSSPLYRCAKCNYYLHIECGPLPCNISFKSQLHTHPLRITNSPMDWEHEQEMDVFYCDECEQERDPRLPVYVCSEGCSYVAEIKCVISEVKRTLLGDNGEVDLRSLITKMDGKVIGKYHPGQDQKLRHDSKTDNDDCNKIIARFTKKDTDFYLSISKAAQQWADQKISTKKREGTVSLFPNEAHHLMNLSSRGKEIFDEDLRIFKVEDHFVKSDFAYLREALGDVTLAKSILPDSPVGDYFRFLLYWTINSMCTTRVVDISQELLSKWWKTLKMVQFAGFNIQFALDHLDRVVFAYYGLLVKEENENLEKVATEIRELDQDIKRLEAILLEKRARLKALQKRHGHVAFKDEVNSSVIDICLREASELKWKIAGEGLFKK